MKYSLIMAAFPAALLQLMRYKICLILLAICLMPAMSIGIKNAYTNELPQNGGTPIAGPSSSGSDSGYRGSGGGMGIGSHR